MEETNLETNNNGYMTALAVLVIVAIIVIGFLKFNRASDDKTTEEGVLNSASLVGSLLETEETVSKNGDEVVELTTLSCSADPVFEVKDQTVGNTVSVESLQTTCPVWVGVHELLSDGEMSKTVLGARLFRYEFSKNSGELVDKKVTLLSNLEVGKSYQAVLYQYQGEPSPAVFDYANKKLLLGVDGAMISAGFKINK